MSAADEYTAIREGAAIGALAPRMQIAVAGADRRAYLQGLLTNDIESLTPGSGCYAAWLTPQGRMITDLHVFESDGMTLLDVPADLGEATVQRLDQFLFTEDVRLESLAGSITGVWVHGPLAPSVVAQVVPGLDDPGEWVDYHHVRAAAADGPVVAARVDQLGVPGFCIYLDPSRREALVEALRGAGAILVGAAALEAARLEEGYPVFGIDMTDEIIPLEAEIEGRAVSFTKGCYVGQEVVIRVLHRGGGRVAKRLVALRVESGAAARGDRLVSGEREIGVVTSAAVSPRLGVIAMGYAHRDFVEPGTVIEVASGDHRARAVVSARPMRAI
jgi:tRNA-modifying protein YgfZ